MPEDDPVGQLRAICMALPEVEERLSHGEPTWFIQGKKSFANCDTYHHGAEHLSFWCAAPPGAQEVLVEARPESFFRPPYVGHRGWLGVYLDVPLDWDEIAMLVEDAYRTVAPPKMRAKLDEGGRTPTG